MRITALTAIAAFLLLSAAQRPLMARDPVVDKKQERAESSQVQKQGPDARLGRAETLSGTIVMVAPSKNTIFVNGANGGTFKFVVQPATAISVKGRRVSLADLSGQLEKTISVTFVPTRRGNFAQRIEVSE